MALFLQPLESLPKDALHLLAYAALGLLLQVGWPARREQRFLRRDLGTDLLHSFVTPFLAAPIVLLLLLVTGVIHLRANGPGVVSLLPFWLQAVAAIFTVDLVGYWRHRLLHTRVGWPLHAVHHSSRELDWLSNDRVEVGELVTTNFLQASALLVCGFSPEMIAVNALLRRTWGFFIHMNAAIPYGPLRWVLVSPTFHRWHHSEDPRARDKNFATFFAGIDWVFGTWFCPADEAPGALGAGEPPVPEGWVSQVAYPWLHWGRTLLGRAG